jgi:hypothetical protein
MSRLYEIERIEAETDQLMSKAAGWPEADRFNDLGAKLEDLLAKHAATINVTNWVLRALALAKGPLMTVAPWGPLAVGAGYTGTLGYVIYVSGAITWTGTAWVTPDGSIGSRASAARCRKQWQPMGTEPAISRSERRGRWTPQSACPAGREARRGCSCSRCQQTSAEVSWRFFLTDQ